jgi:hypothetical protein
MEAEENRGVKKGTKRGNYTKFTDGEIINIISKYGSIFDLRMSDDRRFYCMAKRRDLGDYLPPNIPKVKAATEKKRGAIKGVKKGPYTKYTDEYIINILSKYETRGELRMSVDKNFYYLAMRKFLDIHLPPKKTRCNNLVGNQLEKQKENELKKIEKRMEKIRLREEKRLEDKPNDATIASVMYRPIKVDGKIICGRCLEHDLALGHSKMNKNLCKPCYAKYLYLRQHNRDSNPHNIKDEYCHIKITHHEKIFQIGIKADRRLQDYLTMIGYGFIFKECS